MDIKEAKIFENSKSKQRHPWEMARMTVIENLLHIILRDCNGGNHTVLDFGSGDAFIIKTLSQLSPELTFWGIDEAYTSNQLQSFSCGPFSEKCQFFRQLNDISPKTAQADIVLLLDVLEHVENDEIVLSEVICRLKPGGYALLTVPAFQSLFCNHDRWLGHYRRYTKTTLAALIAKTGLEIKLAGYFFSGLVPPRLIYKLLEYLKIVRPSKEVGIGQWAGGRLFGDILKTFLSINAAADIELARRNMSFVGLSTFAICKKLS